MAKTTPIHSGYTILNGTGTGSNGGRIEVWAEYSVTEQSVEGNSSRVKAYFYAALRAGQSSSTQYSSGLSSSFRVDGTAGSGVENGAYDFTSPANLHLLGSFEGEIAHDSDGSKRIAIEGSFSTRSTYISGGSVSGTVTLPAIARATTPTVQPAVMGEPTTITLTPAAETFTHTLRWSFGSQSGTIATRSEASSISFTFAEHLAAEIPNATSGTVAILCDTYSGSTLIGTRTASTTLQIPADMRPTAGALTASETGGEVPAEWGIYVQGKSRVQLTLQEAAGAGGSSIVAYNFAGGGYSGGSNPFTTGLLLNAGEILFTACATDSRGRQTEEKTVSIAVEAYAIPKLEHISMERCDSTGAADENGTFLKVYFTQQCSACGGHNSAQVKLKYRAQGESGWSTSTALAAGQDNLLSGFAISSTYELSLEITDAFTTGSYGGLLQTAERIVNIRADGRGMALGKMSEKQGLEVEWPVQLNADLNILGSLSVNGNGMADHIVEAGVDGSWEYMKFASGLMLLYTMNLGITMPAWEALGSLYWRTVSISIPLVTSTIYASFGDAGTDYARWTRCSGNWGSTDISVQQYSMNTNGNAAYTRLQGFVVGKWK